MMQKKRLDVLLQEKGLAESRTLAQRMIMAGEVRVNDAMIIKPSSMFLEDANITVDSGPRFVSRGGEKLLGALESFQLTSLDGLICADVGASTGGFTDCLLQHDAAKVYAIDVGYGILHWKLRTDPRVISMEKTNARDVKLLPEPIDLTVIDASFISLKIILPIIYPWGQGRESSVIALIKPQFEAGKAEVAKGAGVIRDPAVHRRVLEETLSFATTCGFGVRGLVRSPLQGPKGNTEFLAWLVNRPRNADLDRLIRTAFDR